MQGPFYLIWGSLFAELIPLLNTLTLTCSDLNLFYLTLAATNNPPPKAPAEALRVHYFGRPFFINI